MAHPNLLAEQPAPRAFVLLPPWFSLPLSRWGASPLSLPAPRLLRGRWGERDGCHGAGPARGALQSWGLEQDVHSGMILGSGWGQRCPCCGVRGPSEPLQCGGRLPGSLGAQQRVWGCSWGWLLAGRMLLGHPGHCHWISLFATGEEEEVNRQALRCFVTPARAVGTSLSLAKLSQRMWEAFSAGLVPAPCYLKP